VDSAAAKASGGHIGAAGGDDLVAVTVRYW
jgi:hypothetical protein